jgi:hypothetical protein
MSAPHPDLLKTPPSEAELIEIEQLFGSYGSIATGFTKTFERTTNSRIVENLQKLIEFARQHQ